MKPQRINLFPDDLKPKRRPVAPILGGAGVAIALIGVIAWGLSVRRDLTALRAEAARVERDTQNVKREIAAFVAAAESKKSEGPTREQMIGQLATRRLYWFEVLQELTLIGMNEGWLDSATADLEAGGLKFAMTGDALTPEAIGRLLNAYENSYFFRGAKLKFSEQLENVQPPLYRFEINATVALGAGGTP